MTEFVFKLPLSCCCREEKKVVKANGHGRYNKEDHEVNTKMRPWGERVSLRIPFLCLCA